MRHGSLAGEARAEARDAQVANLASAGVVAFDFDIEPRIDQIIGEPAAPLHQND